MANAVELALRVLLSIAIAQAISCGCVDGLKDEELVNHPRRSNKAAVKTIKRENGEVIDCIDLYKQPAFDHPLPWNHSIQMKPNSYPSGKKVDKSGIKLMQEWHKRGKCPKGTIPIPRSQNHNFHGTNLHHNRHNFRKLVDNTGHEYAIVGLSGGKYYGAQATINLWNPQLEVSDEFSLSQIWVSSQISDNTNTAEAGWMADGYKGTGCYNLRCPGFVQTNKNFVIGDAIIPVSTSNGKKFDIFISIFKDKGDWWLQVGNTPIGYWPSSIYTSLKDSASVLSWGGEIINTQPGGHHTGTQMGSGHSPSEGLAMASYFRALKVMDDSNTWRDAQGITPTATKASCYDVHISDIKDDPNYGTHFFYGGPGRSPSCP